MVSSSRRLGEGGDLTSRTTLLTVPAASATYTAPSSYGSAIMARILEANRMGWPKSFFDFAALRVASEMDVLSG